MPLIYASVSRGTQNLAEYAAFQGNFSSIGKEFLEKQVQLNHQGSPSSLMRSPWEDTDMFDSPCRAGKNEGKFTYTVDGHTFNFLAKGGFSKISIDSLMTSIISHLLPDLSQHSSAWRTRHMAEPFHQNSSTE